MSAVPLMSCQLTTSNSWIAGISGVMKFKPTLAFMVFLLGLVFYKEIALSMLTRSS